MVMSGAHQMLREVEWGKLDVIVVACARTGDARFTHGAAGAAQGRDHRLDAAGLALIDARRGIGMFAATNVARCSASWRTCHLHLPALRASARTFSANGGARHEAERSACRSSRGAAAHGDRETSEAGRPVVATDPDGPHAKAYREIAVRVRDQAQGAGAGRPAPKITWRGEEKRVQIERAGL